MSRSMTYAAVLLSGVALGVLWTKPPVCVGGSCLGTSSAPEAQRQDKAHVPEVPGAGRGLLGLTAQEPAPAAASEAWLSTGARPVPARNAAL